MAAPDHTPTVRSRMAAWTNGTGASSPQVSRGSSAHRMEPNRGRLRGATVGTLSPQPTYPSKASRSAAGVYGQPELRLGLQASPAARRSSATPAAQGREDLRASPG